MVVFISDETACCVLRVYLVFEVIKQCRATHAVAVGFA